MKKLFLLLVVAILSVGCTRVETGHVGVRVNFNGTYDPQELPPGFHQSIIGSVNTYVANEMTITLDNLKPQTKDKTLMHDMDLTFNYTVSPMQIVEMVTAFKGRDLKGESGDTYPMGLYVSNIVTTATSDVVGKYDALEVNDNRENVRAEILAQTVNLLKQEHLDDKIQVRQIFIKNMQIAPQLTNSALTAITAENELKAKTIQVQVAEQEALRLNMLSKNIQNIQYMQAKAMQDIAEGIKDGKVSSIVVPWDFKGIINVGK